MKVLLLNLLLGKRISSPPQRYKVVLIGSSRERENGEKRKKTETPQLATAANEGASERERERERKREIAIEVSLLTFWVQTPLRVFFPLLLLLAFFSFLRLPLITVGKIRYERSLFI